ncbi:MAG: GAF domain-containing protein [Clostridiales bacterium]|nr:GAF domain-containing protein [Clostridiales bacterium]
MINIEQFNNLSLEEGYKLMHLLVESQLTTEKDFIANLSNISAILKSGLQDINWVGFYLYKENQLVLGPFQGLPACCRIDIGSGVCGKAALLRKTLRVDNVHNFDGHIACDSASNSEIVIPLIKGDSLIGVLDIDSPKYNRFSELDQVFLENIAECIVNYI